MQGPLAIHKCSNTIGNPTDSVGDATDTVGDPTEGLLEFEVLLADPKIELGEPLFVEPLGLSEEADHFLARFAGGHVPEACDERDFHIGDSRLQVGEPTSYFALEVGEAAAEVLVQGIQRHVFRSRSAMSDPF